ncbi:DUF4826 family protein [Shewanella algae]|uniref:DUF4826 family protein n=1 Tax=Shewanella algae TaxID=38313 RepID=UPI000F41FD9C|nr:DUF4826 family protein [Shewanella algae]AYV14036.1 DUF4826 family protein [Shewanella algae]
MTEQTSTPPNAEQQEALRQAWVREQFQKANKFLAEKGVIPSKVVPAESRYLAPYVAMWKIESKQPSHKTYWVMSGDLPSDYVDVSVAATAREALRHFSLTWQLKAENLVQSGATKDTTQAKFAQLLVSRAESLYKIQEDDKLWG